MAAATLRESMPARIGMIARRSAAGCHRDESPWPSEPSTSATLSSPATASSIATASSARVSATVVKPARRQVRQGVVPVRQAGPRQREHRAHGDLDRAAVERVGAPRREQHGVEAERRAAAEDRAHVGVVDDVLEHQHRPRAGEHLVDGGQRRARERGQRAAVDVEAGDLLGQRLGDDVAGRVGARRGRRRARRASAAPSGTSAAGKPASTARRTTFSPSARNSPCSASRCLRSSTSRRSR